MAVFPGLLSKSFVKLGIDPLGMGMFLVSANLSVCFAASYHIMVRIIFGSRGFLAFVHVSFMQNATILVLLCPPLLGACLAHVVHAFEPCLHAISVGSWQDDV